MRLAKMYRVCRALEAIERGRAVLGRDYPHLDEILIGTEQAILDCANRGTGRVVKHGIVGAELLMETPELRLRELIAEALS